MTGHMIRLPLESVLAPVTGTMQNGLHLVSLRLTGIGMLPIIARPADQLPEIGNQVHSFISYRDFNLFLQISRFNKCLNRLID